MYKNIASLSLLIVVGAVAHAVSTPHVPVYVTPAVTTAAPMEPVHFFDEKFGAAMLEVAP